MVAAAHVGGTAWKALQVDAVETMKAGTFYQSHTPISELLNFIC